MSLIKTILAPQFDNLWRNGQPDTGSDALLFQYWTTSMFEVLENTVIVALEWAWNWALCVTKRWNDTDRQKPKNAWEKPVLVSLRPPQIPHGLTWVRTPGVRCEMVENILSCCVAQKIECVDIKLEICSFSSDVNWHEDCRWSIRENKSVHLWKRVPYQRKEVAKIVYLWYSTFCFNCL
jgi:hypothetical protein